MSHDILLKIIRDIAVSERDETDGQSKRFITVLIGGMLVSGYIVSQKDFHLHNQFTDMISEVVDSVLTQRFRELAKLPEGEPVDGSVNKGAETLFLHLAGARFHVPGNCIPRIDLDGVYWRGRLDMIAGFFFGALE